MSLALSEFLEYTAMAFILAQISVAYFRFTQPGEVLAWWARYLYHLRELYADSAVMRVIPSPDDNRSFSAIRQEAYDRSEIYLKPILTCEKCIAGQFALWVGLLFLPFNIIGLLYLIALSSYLATWLLNRLN
ncbi:hypothetical protein [Spirosoma sp.]|uniref:hypothetical protein n=1 Tax=Spirosoma sp. TaxID=1899569 RepID=UPI002620F5CF|nr:hypothetical protein [Spirosoma sp.]MCX6218352.1 hypothetical protein [Spirosoma sp.]